MKNRQTITLGTKPVVVRVSSRPLVHSQGFCKAGGDIVISCDCPEKERLRIFLHEAFHKQFWFLDEEVVHEASAELADALEDLGLA